MTFLWIAVMVVGLVGMIVCQKKQKTNPALQPVAIALFVVVVIGAVLLLKEMEVFGAGSSALDNEMAFASSRGYMAGKYLATKAPGKKVLVITDADYSAPGNEMGQRMLEAIKKGLGSEDVITDTFMTDSKGESMPIDELFKAKTMDELINKHPDAGAVISTVGLPMDFARMKYFTKKAADRPVLVLLNFGMGGANMSQLIKKEYIAAVITSNPDAKYDIKAERDPEKTFAIRYLLITKDNVDANKNALP